MESRPGLTQLLDNIINNLERLEVLVEKSVKLTKPKRRESAVILSRVALKIIKRIKANVEYARTLYKEAVAIGKVSVCKRVADPVEYIVSTISRIEKLYENIMSDVEDVKLLVNDILSDMPRFARFMERRRIKREITKQLAVIEVNLKTFVIDVTIVAALLASICIKARS